MDAGQIDDFVIESEGFGQATPWKPSSTVKRKAKFPLTLMSFGEVGDHIDFIRRMDGRRKPFWMPTYLNDYGLTQNRTVGQTTITVKAGALATKWAVGNQFKHIALLNATKLECYGVTGVSSSGGVETLTLSRGLDSDLNASTTVCCQLFLARLADDKQTIEWTSGDSAKATLSIIELPKEYPAPAEGNLATDSAHFGTRPVYFFLFTDGSNEYTYADYSQTVLAGGKVFRAANISSPDLKMSFDMIGDPIEVEIRTDSIDHPLRAFLEELEFKNLTLQIFRADLDSLGSFSTATDSVHEGRVDQVEFGDEGQITVSISSVFRINERNIPLLMFQRTCTHRTFQGGCHAVEADFTTDGTVTAVSSDPPYIEATEFGAAATSHSDANWFALGKVTVTNASGTETRMCVGASGNRLYLNAPFRHAVVGDLCAAVAGDNKRVTTCNTKFNRLADHLGNPYMPSENPQMEAMKTPQASGGKKG